MHFKRRTTFPYASSRSFVCIIYGLCLLATHFTGMVSSDSSIENSAFVLYQRAEHLRLLGGSRMLLAAFNSYQQAASTVQPTTVTTNPGDDYRWYCSAKCALAEIYTSGWANVVEANMSQAIDLYNQSANCGNATAQFVVGTLYAHGLFGFPHNEGLAVLNYYFSAMAGYGPAATALGYRHLNGIAVPSKCISAATYLELAIEHVLNISKSRQGGFSPVKRYRLTEGFIDTVGDSERDVTQLTQYLMNSAEQGDPKAQAALGHFHYYGARALPQSLSEAVYWLHEAVEGRRQLQKEIEQSAKSTNKEEDKPAEQSAVLSRSRSRRVDWRSTNERGNVNHNVVTTEDEINTATGMAALLEEEIPGGTTAIAILGHLYFEGHGVDRDVELALDYLSEGVRAGHPMAMVSLAKAYLFGVGVPQDVEFAYILLENASKREGFADAHYNLGVLSTLGKNPSGILEESIRLHQGDTKHAKHVVANILLASQRNYRRAMTHFTAAGHGGHIPSLAALGRMQLYGIGSTRSNCANAVQLFRNAIQRSELANVLQRGYLLLLQARQSEGTLKLSTDLRIAMKQYAMTPFIYGKKILLYTLQFIKPYLSHDLWHSMYTFIVGHDHLETNSKDTPIEDVHSVGFDIIADIHGDIDASPFWAYFSTMPSGDSKILRQSAILHYIMAAEMGFELGQWNAALLLEKLSEAKNIVTFSNDSMPQTNDIDTANTEHFDTNAQVDINANGQVDIHPNGQVESHANGQVESHANEQVEAHANEQVESRADEQVGSRADEQVEANPNEQVGSKASVQVNILDESPEIYQTVHKSTLVPQTSSDAIATIALRLLERAAAQGNVEAHLKMGDFYYYWSDQTQLIKRSKQKQLPVSKQPTTTYGQQNAADAQHTTAHGQQKATLAAKYYRAAADLRQPQALFNLGYMYEFGDGLPQDLYLAKRYYDLAVAVDSSAWLPVMLARTSLWARSVWLEFYHDHGILIEKLRIGDPSWTYSDVWIATVRFCELVIQSSQYKLHELIDSILPEKIKDTSNKVTTTNRSLRRNTSPTETDTTKDTSDTNPTTQQQQQENQRTRQNQQSGSDSSSQSRRARAIKNARRRHIDRRNDMQQGTLMKQFHIALENISLYMEESYRWFLRILGLHSTNDPSNTRSSTDTTFSETSNTRQSKRSSLDSYSTTERNTQLENDEDEMDEDTLLFIVLSILLTIVAILRIRRHRREVLE